MPRERYDHSRHCLIPASLLPSDILKLAAYLELEPLEFIALHCSIVSIHEHSERVRKLGIEVPPSPGDLDLYYVQIKAARYCNFYTGKTCKLPVEVRPRQCTRMSQEEYQSYNREKQFFYFEYVRLIGETEDPLKALELYLAGLGLL